MNEVWSEAQNFKLIELFRSYSLIWDKSLDDYRNKEKREQAFEEISAKMGSTKEIIKRKLHSLRTHYCAESKKMAMKKNYQPGWKYFDSLKFMFNVYTDPLKHINRSFSTVPYKRSMSNQLKNEQNDGSTTGSAYDDEPTPPKQQRIYNNLEGEIEILEENDEYFNSVDDFQETAEFNDECSIFGEHVANELRLLKEYRSIQLALKCKIMRAVLEANEALHRSGWNKKIKLDT